MEDVGKELNRIIKSRGIDGRYRQMMEEILADEDVRQFIEEHKEKLTQADIEKSFAKLYEFVQEKKKYLASDPTMIAPGYEPQLSLNFHFIDVTYVPTDELLRLKREEEIRNRVNSLDMPKDIRGASIRTFDNTSGRLEALAASLDFIDHYEEAPKQFHKALYLVGGFGVGKTYLLGAVAHELAVKGFETTLLHFPTFAGEMKQAISKDQVGPKLNEVKHAPILMIDDIGADSMSAWIRDEVLGVILQHRMQEQLPTFFSSNFNMEQLEQHLSVTQRGDEEPLKAQRIMERIRYLSKEIFMVGENRRNG
ncbi:primosomal protein DnaI [Enterococcus dongliensis]|uniref:Primosomal protein DnaI n=1 Tax=Enterococcus dongliensis TaxID=2559925 RepID=A0AAP5KNS2_9ENTE|nr:primosomal protein DnaI [Enterococcus dongliensis]MDT2595886.1 primosomal protein DnaI [Enterococcus dongliensis]MDT2602853.1 primosomal protein DnaI [Enterococcus dongliensis]MDT2633953.1 primosomal protein DnaI [Enterococcus dongliensis]MDT2637285.1 primosomal protein DnaI [Enterococcus dongliensis]MDT2639625.1 primosomal protein DnaI [Enterococcus dongliensis]